MGDQAERVVLEAEDQVSPVVDKANTSLDGFEKKATTAHEKVVRITDQTRTSVQRLVASLEKQACQHTGNKTAPGAPGLLRAARRLKNHYGRKILFARTIRFQWQDASRSGRQGYIAPTPGARANAGAQSKIPGPDSR
jgi:hypothetical protein